MTPHSSTGVSPNMAMFGREVLMPCSLIATPPEADNSITVPFVQSFRDTLRDAHTRVCQNLQATAKTQKIHFDSRIKHLSFHIGQKVWLYWPRPSVKQQAHKLAQLWTGPWEIIEKKSPLIVVLIHPISGKRQTVHVDRLLPCQDSSQSLDSNVSTHQQPIPSSKRRTRKTTTSQVPMTEHQSSSPATPVRRSGRRRRPPPYLTSYV